MSKWDEALLRTTPGRSDCELYAEFFFRSQTPSRELKKIAGNFLTGLTESGTVPPMNPNDNIYGPIFAVRRALRDAELTVESLKRQYDALLSDAVSKVRPLIGKTVTVQINGGGTQATGKLLAVESRNGDTLLRIKAPGYISGSPFNGDDHWTPMLARVAWVEVAQPTRVDIAPTSF